MRPKSFLWLPAALALAGGAAAAAWLWPARPPPPPSAAGADVRALLHLGRRVGRIEELALPPGERGWRVHTVLQIQRQGRRTSLERRLEARVDERGRLVQAELTAGGLLVRGVVEPQGVRLRVRHGGHAIEHRLASALPVHIDETVFRWLAATGLRPARSERGALLDLEHGRLRPVTLRVDGARSWHGIAAHEVAVVEAHGAEWRATVDGQGSVLESTSPVPGVETRRWRPGDEERPVYAVDLGTWGRVMTSGEIRDPARVARLRLRMRGLAPSLGVPEVIEVARGGVTDAAAPAGAFTAAGPFLEADAPEIAALARSLVPPATPAPDAARRVSEWIRREVRPSDAVGPPSALVTLRARRGNCNEMAALAVALLRAAGIGARLAFGIAYHEGAFRYHAWAEVRAEHGWIAFDPTFGQVPADATHVRFSAGGLEAQAGILDAVGRLTVEVLAIEEGMP